MQILSEVSRPYIITSLTSPMGVSHFWSFSGHMMDFKLEKLEYLEETTGPTIKIRAQNLEMEIPASWNLLAVDKETYTIDSIPVTSCAAYEHDVLLFSPDDTKLVTTKVVVLDLEPKKSVIHPMIPKGSAMIHPVGPDISHGKTIFYGIVCGPYDLHRWIGEKTVGDILG